MGVKSSGARTYPTDDDGYTPGNRRVIGRTLIWLVIAALALSSLALINGYPLVFPDTGTYIAQAVKLEGALDRPPYYTSRPAR